MTDSSAPVDNSLLGTTGPPELDRYKWPRRLLMIGALALGLAFVVYTIQRSPESASNGHTSADPAILQQVPAPGSHVLQQTSIGVELTAGYDGRISVNGTAIPEDEMDGAAPPGSPAYDPRYGVRPNNKQHVFFTAGPGKVISKFPTAKVQVSVRYWQIVHGESSERFVNWSFFSE